HRRGRCRKSILPELRARSHYTLCPLKYLARTQAAPFAKGAVVHIGAIGEVPDFFAGRPGWIPRDNELSRLTGKFQPILIFDFLPIECADFLADVKRDEAGGGT